ncbi:MAG: F-type H+-transporting ATPase subunit epsilon [Solirubrobacteraceae bacterium]|jgi:F-type H+-transporting ATPase subunit epsilon|nr:F-type H+-transporting ATPase subunit epsilon [Solirubrobacteraceae bacterium]
MARTKFPVEILSPEGQLFDGEVEMVSTRTTTGSIGILAHHTPLLAILDPTELRLYESENEVIRFAQGEGYLQVGFNRALLLVEEAHRPDELDRAELEDKLKRAEQELEAADEGSETARMAERDRDRWEAFLKVLEDESS